MEPPHLDWRKKSQNRGTKLFIYLVPIFLLSFYSASKTSSNFPGKQASGSKRSLTLKDLRANREIEVALQIPNREKVRFLAQLRSGKDEIKQKHEWPSKIPLRFDLNNFTEPVDVKILLGKKSYRSLSGQKWGVEVRTPRKNSSRIFSFLQMFLIPSVALLCLALVMMVVPRML